MSVRGVQRFLLLGIITAVIVVGLLIFSSVSGDVNSWQEIIDKTGQAEVSIVLTEDGFEPRFVRIDRETTVIFSTTNTKPFWPASNLHPSHGIYREFDPQRPLMKNEVWSFRFEKNGTWGFHDHIRPYFTGIVYVK